jgi:signal transduction histidine kinase
METRTGRTKSFQHQERQDTDQSLGDERVKTNDELNHVRRGLARKTEKELEHHRETTDEAVTVAREASDLERDHERDASGYDRMNDQKIGDYRLRAERQQSDQAVASERARSDLAIETERASKSIAEDQILRNERNLTDTHLKAERDSTDAASGKLTFEVAEHMKTKASLTTREEFLAVVSHDLRNPIGAISTCMDMLLDEAESLKTDEDTRNWVIFAKRNADSALRLISDLLDMERIANGKLGVTFRSEDIGRILRETCQNFSRAAAVKGVRLKVHPLTNPETISCDADRVSQVLSNLVGNALKFTPEGGKIDLTIQPFENEIQVRVSDTGDGIPEDKLERIFDRFAQLGVKDRRGLGLGLHISKMLAEAHRGTLDVESKVGEGSSFTLTLPRRRKSTALN